MHVCGHEGAPGATSFCEHVRREQERAFPVTRRYLGTELDAELLCGPCVAAREAGGPVVTRTFCAACTAALLEDVTGGPPRELPGPAGEFFPDGRTIWTAAHDGLSRWDLTDGARTGLVPDFRPTHFHAGARELVALTDGVLVRLAV